MYIKVKATEEEVQEWSKDYVAKRYLGEEGDETASHIEDFIDTDNFNQLLEDEIIEVVS